MENKIDKIVNLVESLQENAQIAQKKLLDELDAIQKKLDSLVFAEEDSVNQYDVVSQGENDLVSELYFNYNAHGYTDVHHAEGNKDVDFILKDINGQLYAGKEIKLGGSEITFQVIRKIYMLSELHHDNILRLDRIFLCETSLFLIMELVHRDLEHFIKENNQMELKKWMKQLCHALSYLHRRGIAHGDLQPSVLRVTNEGDIKLGGFNSSRGWFHDAEDSPNVRSLQYMAPEILFGGERYGTAAGDMWSLGCVFWYLAAACNPLFELGDGTEHDIIFQMLSKFGVPPQSWPKAIALTSFALTLFASSQPQTQPQALVRKVEGVLGAAGLDLLLKLLTYNPEERISAQDVLNHPFLAY